MQMTACFRKQEKLIRHNLYVSDNSNGFYVYIISFIYTYINLVHTNFFYKNKQKSPFVILKSHLTTFWHRTSFLLVFVPEICIYKDYDEVKIAVCNEIFVLQLVCFSRRNSA